MARKRQEWDDARARATRILTNGTTSGSARALANDVLRMADDVAYWRGECGRLAELVRRQLAQLEKLGEDVLVAELEEFLRSKGHDDEAP